MNVVFIVFLLADLEGGNEIRIVYVPSHLHHILFEIFKNSMRAVMEHHGTDATGYPPLKVTVVRGREDICVKVHYTYVLYIYSYIVQNHHILNNVFVRMYLHF